MWVKIEKDNRTLTRYSYILVLFVFLALLNMDYFKEKILCRTFQLCYNREYVDSVEVFKLIGEPDRHSIEIKAKSDFTPTLSAAELNNDLNSSSDGLLRKWKKKILIFSLARSGSSFLGEIFNRREDVFYFYEPLHTLNTFAKVGMFQPVEYTFKASDILRDFLRCKFSNYEDHLKFMSYPELCNPHFRLMSKALSTPPFCKKHILSNATEKEYRRNCYALVPSMLKKRCMEKKSIVIKELVHRLPLQSINGVLPLFKDALFRAICLIRDPRAVISSMKNIGGIGETEDSFATSIEEASSKVCKILSSHFESLSLPDLIIRSKLVAIRYEDIVSQPEDAIRNLFHSLEIHLDKKTIDWVIENTHGQLDNTIDSFSVFLRNVSYSLNSWRQSLTFPQIRMIQGKCGSIMRKFGYVIYRNEREVSNLMKPAYTNRFDIDNIIKVT